MLFATAGSSAAVVLVVVVVVVLGVIFVFYCRARMTAHKAKVASVAQSLALDQQDALDDEAVRMHMHPMHALLCPMRLLASLRFCNALPASLTISLLPVSRAHRCRPMASST